MKKVGVLFDLDGVLIDSEGLYTQFWEDIERIYPTNIPNFAHIIKGNALFKILDTYYPKHLHQDIIDRVHRFELGMVYPIYDGVVEFLEELKSQDIPCAIVTSSDNVKMDTLFRQYPFFKPYFSAIITGSDVTKSKPDPRDTYWRLKLLIAILATATCLRTRYKDLMQEWHQAQLLSHLPQATAQILLKKKPTRLLKTS